MKSTDQEWRELRERYEEMSDDQLHELTCDAWQLTDIAREVLRSELPRRGLRVELRMNPPSPEEAGVEEREREFDPEELELVSIGQVWDMADARRTREILEYASVPSYFGPNKVENVELLQPFFETEREVSKKRGFEVGIRLLVPAKYSQLGMRALANADRPERQNEGAPEEQPYYAATCPKCHSAEIVFQELEGDDSPIDSKFHWTCDACGHRWTDGGLEENG